MSPPDRTADRGFTLVELLVVVTIIGILTAIAIPVFLSQRDSAYRAQLLSELRTAAGQMELEYHARGTYPDAAGITFDPAPLVTLSLEEPAAGGGQVFCITGRHARVDGGEVALSWDSDGGGRVAGNAC